ncbi:pentapeptide repeat-containing protein [Anabaena cylindrica FACHB-243]|nr:MULTISPECIES: pentapeptide repeat-containing protein [Anabaena]MBD2420410.1 pentapeptide repeat-containing protein [Anabaena cylindrica FACHB-243]MBY5281745.1 pentapeptide repeat-containing protein [Anabaena sp. CCAP 1446/1C]MBY5310083.1 pentapeptide repeat-containing protein [Anabaena sp. CCAP 1446/1C]MCM2406964.1 pentapeptide repeat-containing protein [Anabaena sp. CCAP 1446/1C]
MLEINENLKHDRHNKHYQDYLMKVVAQLENNSIATSLDAINDLEHLAGVNPQYHWIIMDMLTNFVRNKAASISPEEVTNNSAENARKVIQAAITVIGRRDTKYDPENEQIDLSYTDLRGVNLQGANLEQTNLYQANLSEANLAGANLEGAILSAANLSGANLNFANLSQAILSAANLRGANLSSANLHRANLYLASLQDAILNDAILDEANLREVQFRF